MCFKKCHPLAIFLKPKIHRVTLPSFFVTPWGDKFEDIPWYRWVGCVTGNGDHGNLLVLWMCPLEPFDASFSTWRREICPELNPSLQVVHIRPESVGAKMSDGHFWNFLICLFQTCITKSRERKGLMKSTKDFWSKKHFDNASQYSDHWLISRTHHARGKQAKRLGCRLLYS